MATAITIWPQVKGRPPTTSLRGQTIVMGEQANKPVYFGQNLVLDGEEEAEPTLEQEERDSEARAVMRGAA